MIEKYRKKVKQRIEDYCRTNYEKLSKDQLVLGKGIFNHRCQHNAVQQVKEGNASEVYSCVCLNRKFFPVVHFINKNKDGKFVDNTLGYQFELYDYYIIRKIEESEFDDMDNMLTTIKESLLFTHSDRLRSKLFGITVENLGI